METSKRRQVKPENLFDGKTIIIDAAELQPLAAALPLALDEGQVAVLVFQGVLCCLSLQGRLPSLGRSLCLQQDPALRCSRDSERTWHVEENWSGFQQHWNW